MSDVQIPQELVETMQQDKAVLFLGPGISAAAGLPSGQELARQLADKVGLEDIRGMSLSQVAQTYGDRCGRRSLVRLVADRLDAAKASPSRAHELIAALPFKKIVTTNWDNLLEQAFDKGRKATKIVRDTDIPYAEDDEITLIKLYGSLEQPDSLVITQRDYDHLQTSKPLLANLVGSYLATRTALFLGFGLTDMSFIHLNEEMAHPLGGYERRACAVMRQPSEEAVKYWARRNVQIIDADVIEFLEALTVRLADSERERAIRSYQESIERFKKTNDLPGLRTALQHLGVLLEEDGYYPKAIQHYEQAKACYAPDRLSLEERRERAEINYRLGRSYKKTGRWYDALDVQRETFEEFKRLGDFDGQARTLFELGHLYHLINNFELARLYYKDAFRLFTRAGNALGGASAKESLGMLELQVQLLPQANHDLREAMQMFAKLGAPSRTRSIQRMIELAQQAMSDPPAEISLSRVSTEEG